MKKLFWIMFVCGIVALFQACTTIRHISFERLQAADVNFPEQITTVGVVNYMPPFVPDSAAYSSGRLEGDGKVVAERLAQEIAATRYFNRVVIGDSALCTTLEDWEQPMPFVKADSLIRTLGVDMLFSVERVQIQLQESSYFQMEQMAEIPVLDGIITPLVRTYIPGRSNPLFSFSKTDTIYWELMPGLTYEQIIKDASEYAAQLPMDCLLPHWTEVDRIYFDGGNVNMRDAGVYVREQDWNQACLLWQELYDTKKGKVKMRAAYNLALYYELQEDFVRAKEYLETALALAPENSWEMQFIQYYQLQLDEQAKLNQRLKVQMKRFEP